MTTIDHTKLAGIVLNSGSHTSPDQGMCLLEAVAYIAGEPHSAHPRCVSPILGGFGRRLNDVLPAGLRQQLIPLIPDLPGTADDGHDVTRGYMALDWLVRTWLPAWLDLVPTCRDDAVRLRELGRIVDLVSAERAGPIVRGAQQRVAAAGAAAGAAAVAAAGDAAWDAAWDTAVDAAVVAAVDVAGAAAVAAAVVAAGVAAGAAAVAAAVAAAGAAAGAAAVAAAGDVLQPTVTQLQHSAIDLYTRMTRVGQ